MTEKTRRYLDKRELVLDAASTLINEKGAAGMTLAGVADAVGLNTASVTYYFKRRDDLAIACYDRALARIEDMVAIAGQEDTPRLRVRRYIDLNLDQLARLRGGEARPITVLSDLRAMDDPVRAALSDRYRQIMRDVRRFFGPDGDAAHKRLLIARVHILLENMYWLPVWIDRYSRHDFARVQARLFEVFDHGLAPRRPDSVVGQFRPLQTPDLRDDDEGATQQKFLQAATRLINERGYRGASVERIASELHVTKGSFYHHLEAKDDLVLSCFRRSFATVTDVQRAADVAGGDHLQRLMTALSTLLDIQFTDRGPLLRTTALQALPKEFRARVIDRSNRMARRFSATIIDGISEGSIRAVDPLIAAQMILPMVNSAYELRRWAEAGQGGLAEAIATYGSTIAFGLFDD